jgi:hypothetical protein
MIDGMVLSKYQKMVTARPRACQHRPKKGAKKICSLKMCPKNAFLKKSSYLEPKEIKKN